MIARIEIEHKQIELEIIDANAFFWESFAEVEQQQNQIQKEWAKMNCSANKCKANERIT